VISSNSVNAEVWQLYSC